MGLLTKESAKTIAEWWANKVAGRPHHDNGSNDAASLLSGIFADTMNKEVTTEQKNLFVDILTKKLLEEDEKNGRFNYWLLECDYAPSKFLSDIAKEAGIPLSNFPWKTFMRVEEDGRVLVFDGYCQPPKQIWPIL